MANPRPWVSRVFAAWMVAVAVAFPLRQAEVVYSDGVKVRPSIAPPHLNLRVRIEARLDHYDVAVEVPPLPESGNINIEVPAAQLRVTTSAPKASVA